MRADQITPPRLSLWLEEKWESRQAAPEARSGWTSFASQPGSPQSVIAPLKPDSIVSKRAPSHLPANLDDVWQGPGQTEERLARFAFRIGQAHNQCVDPASQRYQALLPGVQRRAVRR